MSGGRSKRSLTATEGDGTCVSTPDVFCTGPFYTPAGSIDCNSVRLLSTFIWFVWLALGHSVEGAVLYYFQGSVGGGGGGRGGCLEICRRVYGRFQVLRCSLELKLKLEFGSYKCVMFNIKKV